MSVTQDSTGNFYSNVTGTYYATADEAHTAEADASGVNLTMAGGGYGSAQAPTAADPAVTASQNLKQQGYTDLDGDGLVTSKDVRLSRVAYGTSTANGGTATDYQVQTYAPGKNDVAGKVVSQVVDPTTGASTGSRVTTETTDPSTGAKTGYSQQMAVQNADGTIGMIPVNNYNLATAGNRQVNAPLTGGSTGTPGVSGAAVPSNPNGDASAAAQQAFGGDSATTSTPAGTQASSDTTPAGAPTADSTASDKSIAGVNNTISQLLDLANKSPQTSAAEAQLMKSDQLARIRDQQSLAQNQAAALGNARSGNRRDQALLERQAVAQGTYLGQADQRNQVVQQAELEGNLANLRANEEQTDFTNRANILSKAADLGLNVAALQVDVSKANLGAASNYLNDQFQQADIKLQLTEDQAKATLAYMQAMSAIQFDYDKMGVTDQEHTEDLMMQRYGIDKQTATALAQIKAGKEINWGQLLVSATSSAVGAAAGVGTKALLA